MSPALHVALFVVSCIAWSVAGVGIGQLLLRARPELALPRLTERIEQELRNPDPDVRAALREVDHIGWAAPPVAVPEPVPPTVIAGGAVRVAPAAQITAAEQMRALQNAGWASSEQQPALMQNAPPSSAQQQMALAANMASYGPAAVSVILQDMMNPPPRVVIDSRPWFWPYVEVQLSSGQCILRERFGGGTVSTEWLEMHRHDIVQALRKGNFDVR